MSQNLIDTKNWYAHVEKLALVGVHVGQRFFHYILLQKNTMIFYRNPLTYILTRPLLGGKYSKWIFILQEFYLDFTTAKSKKSLIFSELICALSSTNTSTNFTKKIPDETLFMINTLDPWYGDVIFNFKPKLHDRVVSIPSTPYLTSTSTLSNYWWYVVSSRCWFCYSKMFNIWRGWTNHEWLPLWDMWWLNVRLCDSSEDPSCQLFFTFYLQILYSSSSKVPWMSYL